MTNGEWIAKEGISYKKIEVRRGAAIGLYEITSPEGITFKSTGRDGCHALTSWLDMEHKVKILDDRERKYLGMVIAPFHDDVQYLYKGTTPEGRERIVLYAIRDNRKDYMYFPSFHHGEMYNGMKMNRHYKLEELGL